MSLAAVGSALATLLSCRQIAGINDDPPGNPTGACGLPYGTNPCASCVSTSCCAASSACAADAVCSSNETCLGNCKGDPMCRARCAASDPAGTASAVSALSACLASKCETECGLVCGGLAPVNGPPGSAASCQDCLQANPSTCDSVRTCASAPECDALFRCIHACGPAIDCRFACEANDAGVALASPPAIEFLGGAGSCAMACGTVDSNWSCVGNQSGSKPKSATATLTLGVGTSSLTSIPGVDVAMCTACPCVGSNVPSANLVLARGTTDPSGMTTLQFANRPSTDGQGVNGCWQLTSPGFVPEFVYWGYPLSEPRTDLRLFPLRMFTTSELQMVFDAAGATQDPGGGILLFSAVDCFGKSAPGVRVTMSMSMFTAPFTGDAPLQTEFYGKVAFQATGNLAPMATTLQGTLDPSATETGEDGSGGFLNAFPQVPTLEADPATFGGTSSSQETVAIQAGTITVVTLVPNQ